MIVYDFDGVIVPYQSWMKIFFFMAHKYQKNKIIPLYMDAFKLAFAGMIKYRLGFNDFKMDNRLCSVITKVDNQNELLEQFTKLLYEDIMKGWYPGQMTSEDVWISCSPEFYLRPLADMLGIKHVIGTKVDLHDGSILGTPTDNNPKRVQNIFCQGNEKLKRFREMFPKETIDKFYTDNPKHDKSLIAASNEAFLVTKYHVDDAAKISFKTIKR